MSSRTRRVGFFATALAITLVFGYLAVRDVRFGEVWDAFAASDYRWLLPALGVLALGVFIRAWRWRLLFAPETRPPLRAVSDALLIGYFYNNILPARGGELLRIVALKRLAATSRAETAATVVVERIYDVLGLLLLFFATLAWLPPVNWLRAASVLAIVFSAALLALVFVLLRFGDRPTALLSRVLALLPFVSSETAGRAALSSMRGLASLRFARVGAAAFLVTILSWIAMSLSFWFVTLAFDLGVSPLAGVLVAVATGLSMILPSSPAALGVFEAAAVAAVTAYGVGRPQALSYALLLHALNFFPYLVAGALVIRLRVPELGRAERPSGFDGSQPPVPSRADRVAAMPANRSSERP